MLERYQLLDEHLEHVSKALQQSHRADTVRAEATLESGTHLTFVVDIEKSQQRIYRKKHQPYEHTLCGHGEPFGHERKKPGMDPVG